MIKVFLKETSRLSEARGFLKIFKGSLGLLEFLWGLLAITGWEFTTSYLGFYDGGQWLVDSIKIPKHHV